MDDAVEEMTRQDVWDDSALVQSWNEALAEYKVSTNHKTISKCRQISILTFLFQKYHSIHATGRSLDGLLSEYVCTNALPLSH